MAVRALNIVHNAIIRTYIVKSGTTTAVGKRVKFDTSDGSIDNAGANEDLAIGTALEVVVGDGVKLVQVALDFHAIVPMLVGTGGATRGTYAVMVADGVANAAASGVTNARPICGKFLQTGVAGDIVGVGLMNTRITTA